MRNYQRKGRRGQIETVYGSVKFHDRLAICDIIGFSVVQDRVWIDWTDGQGLYGSSPYPDANIKYICEVRKDEFPKFQIIKKTKRGTYIVKM